MRYRLMATYLGVPYHAGLGPDGNEATLFSPGPPPDELGFTAAGGHWRKQVNVTDLDALWQSRLVGEYRGEPCLVLDDLGDRLHIVYLGRDSVRARQLGYWEIDREVFEVVVARQDSHRPDRGAGGVPAGFGHVPAVEPGSGPLAAGPAGSAGPRALRPAAVRRPRPPSGPARCGRCRGRDRSLPPSRAAAASRADTPGRIAGRTPGRIRPGTARPGLDTAGADRPSSTPDRMAAWHGSPETEPWSEPRPDHRLDPRPDLRVARPDPLAAGEPGPSLSRGPHRRPGGAAGRRDRVPQSVFAELLSLAAIPHAAYAVDEEVPGAMCLVKADGGFEVFRRTDDARLDVRFFEDEEAAYFYLFGVLAAEAVRSGRLRPGTPNGHVNGSRGPGVPSAPTENVSKYLRRKKLPKSAPRSSYR